MRYIKLTAPNKRPIWVNVDTINVVTANHDDYIHNYPTDSVAHSLVGFLGPTAAVFVVETVDEIMNEIMKYD